MEFYERLRQYRKEILGLTQVEAAKRLNISKNSLSQYESGKREFPNRVLMRLIKHYEMTPQSLYEILTGTPYNNEPSSSSMILREKFENSETERVMDMLESYPEINRLFSTASYYDKKKQRDFFNKIKKVIETIEG